MVGAVVQQSTIDEFGPVVAVEAQDAEGQVGLKPLYSVEHGLLALVAQPGTDYPAGRHVDRDRKLA